MLMHSHPSGPALHFRNIAGVELILRQCRDTLQKLAFRLCDLRFSISSMVLAIILRGLSFAFFIQLPFRGRRFALK